MRVLLDTHAFIWWASDPARLSSRARTACESGENAVLLSVVSVWEMQIKLQLGKLQMRLPLADVVAAQRANGIEVLPVELRHVLALSDLPLHHKDPFDRLLIAQAVVDDAVLVTHDPVIARYPVSILW